MIREHFPRTIRKKNIFNYAGDINQPGSIPCGACDFKAEGQNALEAATVLVDHLKKNKDAAHRRELQWVAKKFQEFASKTRQPKFLTGHNVVIRQTKQSQPQFGTVISVEWNDSFKEYAYLVELSSGVHSTAWERELHASRVEAQR